MQIGALFPTGEIGRDPAAIRAYAQGIEDLGFAHLSLYEHVLGVDASRRPGWQGAYTVKDAFHEPLTLLSFVAAATVKLGLATCVLVAPQRQTALLAKQTAELSMLSGNRFRLGLGIGWSEVEYEGLGVQWARRGSRLDEQIILLRRLWTEEAVDFRGEFHAIGGAGINPLPIAPIPIWLGGGASERTIDRIVRSADGWMPAAFTAAEAEPGVVALRERAALSGRDAGEIGIDGRVMLERVGKGTAAASVAIDAWAEIGATHVTVGTHGIGCTSVDHHLAVLSEIVAGRRLGDAAPTAKGAVGGSLAALSDVIQP